MNTNTSHTDLAGVGKSAAQTASQATVDVLDVLKRHLALICCCGAVGMLLGVVYWANAEVWYESQAKMLVTLKDVRSTGEGSSAWGEDRIQDEILANHMEIVRSRNIIERALENSNWEEMTSILEHLDEEIDHIDYVAEHLTLTKGGTGTARDARSLNISFRHTDPDDGLIILKNIVAEYEAFLDDQVYRTMSAATELIKEAQLQVEDELKKVEAEYVAARQAAPILYSGEGTSNVYLDQFRRLQDELVTVDIERSAVSTRLRKVKESLREIAQNKGDTLEMLALIDSASLERLGSFATLRSGNTVDFLAQQPARQIVAGAKYETLTSLRAELSKMEANFGPGHPQVENLRKEIMMIENLVEKSQDEVKVDNLFDQLSPSALLKAYTGFLEHDLAALNERRQELEALATIAEQKSKQLIEFELRDKMLSSEIERKQNLYDGIVEQLRNMDTAMGLSGYMHEVLDAPQEGEIVWPDLKICGAAGLMLGLLFGAAVAFVTDQMDNRFRSPSEIDSMLSLPVIGQVGRIRTSRDKRKKGRMIVDAQAPEAEAFRLLRTYLLREVKAGNLQTAMVTSCQTQDGKSTIMANLGASFSELGLRTLIIDGDMRAPTQHRFFDLQINKGLSELLRGEAELSDIVQPTGIEGLSLMTAGGAVRNPAELLQSETFDNLLTTAKSEYDLILVDCGPVLMVSDPAIVAQKCDAAMLVIRAATDTKRKVAETVRRLRASSTNLRGCIVNTYGSNKDFARESGESDGYYYGYGYGYGGRGYGRRVDDNGEASKSSAVSSSSNGHHSNGGPHIKNGHKPNERQMS